jgi:protein-L-isoaspartate(D-aspartate) O-methyltransferase
LSLNFAGPAIDPDPHAHPFAHVTRASKRTVLARRYVAAYDENCAAAFRGRCTYWQARIMCTFFRVLATVAIVTLVAPGAAAAAEFDAERRALIADIDALARETGRETGRPAFDARVMAAMAKVERHRFVPAGEVKNAYRNRPLPIGYGQTISQPYIVALMTDLMNLKPGDTVLEIGTGSGYQAAIAAELAKEVCTIEIVEPLAREAEARLRAQGYARVRTRTGDGYHGWEDCGPFDAIIVTAAASHVPPPLVKQLKPGGRMVIPVGPPFLTQQLMLVEKRADGTVATRQVLPVAFVPLTGKH